ncbi:MAG: hypothetical protein NUW12_08350 [Firmicutes bacterium]|nr:hypothetical protein [Bacillota bacterium]MDH7495341.1 hypothetical protein [Bacillota bacterium]
MKWPRILLGVVVALIGLWLLLYNLDVVSSVPWFWWPLAPLGLGAILHWMAFAEKGAEGLFIPGGFLTTVGALFLACQFFGWDILEYLWPVFPLAVGVGFLETYLFGGRRVEFLIPAVPTLGAGVVGLSATLGREIGRWLLPAAIIVIGFLMLLAPGAGRRRGPRAE